METKFARFLRSGGNGEFVIGRAPTGIFDRRFSFASKMDIPGFRQIRSQFEANLDRADLINQEQIFRFTRGHFSSPLEAADLADVTGDKQAALVEWDSRIATLWEEWSGRPDRFPSLRRAMEDDLITSFAGLINERRQRELGIDQYTWWSQDDAKVRPLHAQYDGGEFDWEEPPEDGHPGQAHNCRCVAMPFLLDEEPYRPLTDQEFSQVTSNAELDGNALANKDFLTSLGDSFAAIPGFMDGASRYLVLRESERNSPLNDAETQELGELRANIDARASEVAAALADIPEALTGSWRYRRTVSLRADEVAVAYLEGRATEGQLLAAYRDRGYADRAFILGILPIVMALRLPSVRGRPFRLPDSDTIRDFWRNESGAVGFRPIGSGWRIENNPGIVWGGPVRDQGLPWESRLAVQRADEYVQLHPNFRTFDFRSLDGTIAISAKTLNTTALGYLLRPTAVFGRLRRYINQIDGFEEYTFAGDRVASEGLTNRELELAVPEGTTSAQKFQIQRAIDYAAERGIMLHVTLIRG